MLKCLIRCNICFDCNHEEYATLGCGHVFCSPCLTKALKVAKAHQKCPSCRAPVPPSCRACRTSVEWPLRLYMDIDAADTLTPLKPGAGSASSDISASQVQELRAAKLSLTDKVLALEGEISVLETDLATADALAQQARVKAATTALELEEAQNRLHTLGSQLSAKDIESKRAKAEARQALKDLAAARDDLHQEKQHRQHADATVRRLNITSKPQKYSVQEVESLMGDDKAQWIPLLASYMSEMERCQRTAREAQDAQAQALKVIEEANSAAALRANYTARDLKRVEKERDDARRASLQLECVIETLRQQLAAFAPSPRPTTAAVTGPSAGRAPANHFAQQPVAAAADPRVKPPAPKRPRGEAADTFWGQQGVHRPAVVHGTSQPQATSVPQHGSTSISGIHRADMASLGCHTGARGKSSTISSEHVEDDDALDSLADLVDLVDEEEEGSQAGDDQAAYPLGTGPAGAAGADDGRGEAWQADADAWGMQADAGGDENAAVSMHAAQQDEWMDASCTMQEGVQQPHGVADEDVMWHGEDEMHAHGRGHAAPPLPHGLVGAPRPSFVAHRSGKPMVSSSGAAWHAGQQGGSQSRAMLEGPDGRGGTTRVLSSLANRWQVSAPQGAQAGRSHIGLMAGTRPGGCVSSSSMFGRGRGGGGGMPAGGRGKASAEQAGIKSFFTKQTR